MESRDTGVWSVVDRVLTAASWIGMAVFALWFTAFAYFQVAHLWDNSNKLVHVQTVVEPTLKKQIVILKKEIPATNHAKADAPSHVMSTPPTP